MTRRIAAAILLTSWAILLIGGAASYVSIRRVLLAELDDSLVLRASSLPEVLGFRPGGEGAAAVPAGDRYVIKGRLGQTLARPAAGPGAAAAAAARPAGARVLAKSFATLADGTRARTVTVAFPGAAAAAVSDGSGPLTVIYSGSAVRFDEVLERLAWVLMAIAASAGAVVAAVAVRVARVALRPLRAAAGTLATIDDRTLDRRLDLGPLPEEIRPVGERMNQLLARLEQGIGERRRFLADAAHELRTPVTGLTTTLEVALRRPRDAASMHNTLRDCLTDARLLRRLVEMLLEQFRLDTSPAAATLVETDVSAVLDLCASSVATVSKLRGVTVVRAYGADVTFPTQPERLRSVVGNLLTNGIEYNRPGGEVEVACEVRDTDSGDEVRGEGTRLASEPAKRGARDEPNGRGAVLRITVRDTGPGIAAEDRERVFEPFYRPQAGGGAASGRDGHAGLGLYLVRAHVQALGGTCRLDSRVGEGSCFTIELPRPPGMAAGRRAAAAAGADQADAHGFLTQVR